MVVLLAFQTCWDRIEITSVGCQVLFLQSTWQVYLNFFDNWSVHRSVKKTLNLVFCATGFVPAPVIYGTIIDSTCLIWQETCDGGQGACQLYKTSTLRHLLHGVTLSFQVSCLDLFITLPLQSHPKTNPSRLVTLVYGEKSSRVFPKWISMNSVNHDKIQKWYCCLRYYPAINRYITICSNRRCISITTSGLISIVTHHCE